MMCVAMVFFRLILFETLCFLDLDVYLLLRLRKFSTIMFSNMFFSLFSLFPYGTPVMWNLLHLMWLQKFLKLFSFLFPFFYSASVISSTSSSRLLNHASASFNLLLSPSNVSLSIAFFLYTVQRSKWQPTPLYLPGKSHDRGDW